MNKVEIEKEYCDILTRIWSKYSHLEVLNDSRFEYRKSPFDTSSINGKKVPTLFSGMLSAQRALDIGSQERLM